MDDISSWMTATFVLADTWEEIFKRLTGADFWIVLGCTAVGLLCWRWIGAGTADKPVLRLQIGAAMALALPAGVVIWINHAIFQREPVFSKDLTGILIVRIVGDDAENSLQRELVAKLNAELQKEPVGQRIEVRAGREIIDETNIGLEHAHERARTIGQRLEAKLVIWGLKGSGEGFYPRITVVNPPKNWSEKSERTQNITELRLPEELVDEPSI
jgi:hypothetical protein